jgi:voltage-gated potassium channel
MNNLDSLFRVFILPLLIFVAVLLFGTVGYMYFNNTSFIDALQLVVVTISTCGLRQPTTTSQMGKVFDIVFIIISFTAIISVLSRSFSLVIEGQMKGIQQRDKVRHMLKKVKDHYIVCGFGRVGSHVAEQLKHSKTPVVAIDSNDEAEERLRESGIPYVIGTISSDDILKKANIDHAKGLVACADSDTENVFVVLSARTINPKLEIIARASDPANEEKLKRAGANYVVSPYLTIGQKISNMLLNPSVANYVDRVMHDQTLEVWFHEIKVPKSSKFAGKTIKQLDPRHLAGVTILAIRRAEDNTFITSPNADTGLRAEDVLICLGSQDQVNSLKKLF